MFLLDVILYLDILNTEQVFEFSVEGREGFLVLVYFSSKSSWLWCPAKWLTAWRENPTVCLAKRRCLMSACKVTNKMAFAELVRGKRGAEISLISRLVRCISLWALLIMSNQSKAPTWKNWLLQKKKKREKETSEHCVIFPSLSSRRQRRAAQRRLSPSLWDEF